MKQCPNCRELKDRSEFSKDRHKADGLCSWCKECIRSRQQQNKEKLQAYTNQYYQDNKERLCQMQKQRNQNNSEARSQVARRARLRYNYDISLEEYNDLFSKQEGKCAICGTHQSELNKSLCVDHDHETGEVRGLLCRTCNAGLGMFKEQRELFLKALEYLIK